MRLLDRLLYSPLLGGVPEGRGGCDRGCKTFVTLAKFACRQLVLVHKKLSHQCIILNKVLELLDKIHIFLKEHQDIYHNYYHKNYKKSYKKSLK